MLKILMVDCLVKFSQWRVRIRVPVQNTAISVKAYDTYSGTNFFEILFSFFPFFELVFWILLDIVWENFHFHLMLPRDGAFQI